MTKNISGAYACGLLAAAALIGSGGSAAAHHTSRRREYRNTECAASPIRFSVPGSAEQLNPSRKIPEYRMNRHRRTARCISQIAPCGFLIARLRARRRSHLAGPTIRAAPSELASLILTASAGVKNACCKSTPAEPCAPNRA